MVDDTIRDTSRNAIKIAGAYRLFGDPFICAYCGALADSIDHAVPQVWINGNVALISRFEFVAVHACRDCNLRAAAGIDRSFLDRRRRIAKSLRKRARKLLCTADWLQEELDELGPMLRATIGHAQKNADIVRARLRTLDTNIVPNGIPNDLWIPLRHDPMALKMLPVFREPGQGRPKAAKGADVI